MTPCTTQGYCTPGYEATDDCKYSYSQDKYLFNITADPYEQNDLSSDKRYASTITEMEARIAHYSSSMVDPAYKSSHYHAAYTAWASNDFFVGPFLDTADDLDGNGHSESQHIVGDD